MARSIMNYHLCNYLFVLDSMRLISGVRVSKSLKITCQRSLAPEPQAASFSAVPRARRQLPSSVYRNHQVCPIQNIPQRFRCTDSRSLGLAVWGSSLSHRQTSVDGVKSYHRAGDGGASDGMQASRI